LLFKRVYGDKESVDDGKLSVGSNPTVSVIKKPANPTRFAGFLILLFPARRWACGKNALCVRFARLTSGQNALYA
jgi:hypothetical protein